MLEPAACAAGLVGVVFGDGDEAWADATGLADDGAGEAVSEETYFGIAMLFRLVEADGDGACLALTRLLLACFATISTSIQEVYNSLLP